MQPSSFDAEKRSVQVIFSTGAGVARRDYEGDFLEVLDMSPTAVDLSQLRGAPVLDNHDRFSGVASVLGVVEDATVDGARGVATLKLSQRPELAGFRQDIQDGIIRAVSAGYSVETWQTSKRSDGMRIKTATKWTPKEISFTALGADPGAKTRSKEVNMDLQTQFRTIATAVGVPVEFADGLATRNLPVEEARTEMIREAAKLLPPIQNHAPAIVTRDAADGLVSRMADGFRARFNRSHKPTTGQEFASCSVSDLARHCLQSNGRSTLGDRAQLIERAMQTTSDFPAILQESLNKELFTISTSPSPILQVFKKATANDFRARHILEVSDGSDLEEVSEAGEITQGIITDNELASYSVKSYAKRYNISFQTLVNDDMGALSDLSGKITNGARRWFVSLLVSKITSNPALHDGVAVFHADHANLAGSGAAPSDITLAAARLAIRKQEDLSGNPIGATPKYILIPAAHETTVEKLLATLYPQTASAAEVSARGLVPIVEPRLDASSATAWYLFADPSEAPVFEYAELSGYQGPQIQVQEGFTSLGTEMRVVWHVGAGAIDSRGGYKNAGA